MRHRLAAQLGFGIAVVVVAAAAAMADSGATPGSTAQQSGGSSVSVQSSAPVSVDVSQTQSQAVGPGSSDSAGSDSSNGAGVAGGGTGGQVAPLSAGTAADLSTLADASGAPAGGAPLALAQSGDGSSGSATNSLGNAAAAATTTPTADITTQIATSIAMAISRVAHSDNPFTPSAVIQVARPSAAPQPNVPTLPQSPVALLDELHTLLTSTVVPIALGLGGVALPLVTATASLLAIILVLDLAMQVLPANTHTARLRRSGFLGAARSDVGGSLSLFATPLEMGCIEAYAFR